MTTPTDGADPGRRDAGAPGLRAAALVLGLVVAGLHLWWGLPRFLNYASVGVMPDPRPVLFVLSSHAILVGVTLVGLGVVDARRTYLPGAGLMLAHLVGYVAWHTVYDHGLEPGGHHAAEVVHVERLPVVVADHLLHSPLALAAALAEVAVLALLAALVLRARRR